MIKPSCDALKRYGSVVGYTQHGLLVDVSVKEACQQCAQGRGCGMGILARQQRQRIEVTSSHPAPLLGERYPLGSQVTLSLERSDITLLALLIYALPLVMALLLAGCLAAINVVEWAVPASFFATLLIGVLGLKYLLSGRTERFRPRLVS
ncbi:SoxR reducing system RseC family protein [Vreelandella zhanjiangensis]|uniref:SoxR reducing system RseC family protein n=1 Tax=Vreelandella zhanjiangensis TaxID=1121960 RepID=UPI00036109DB|nr:SoxR reducing system RseC family protein [Halomonas zhanjiangensis]